MEAPLRPPKEPPFPQAAARKLSGPNLRAGSSRTKTTTKTTVHCRKPAAAGVRAGVMVVEVEVTAPGWGA